MFSSKKQKDLRRYIDPTGEFSNRELKLSEWYIRHKLLLQKIGTMILIIWCTISMSIGLGYFGYYLIFGYSQDQLMYAHQTIEFQNYESLQALYQPHSLQIRNVQIYEGATDRYDFVAQVLNPNERWLAYVTYKYKYNDTETASMETEVLPGEQFPMVYFGVDSQDYPNQPELILENVSWKKVNPHVVKDVPSYIEERKMFELENFKFTPASRTAGIPSNMIEFDLFNASAYSYWEPKFIVELIDEQVVGYLYLSEDQFRAGDIRHIDIRSLIPNLNVFDIKVYPIINVFDKNEFMTPGK